MNVETKLYKIESAAAFGAGFILTAKATRAAPAWHLFLESAPPASRLAAISENQFNREAAQAMESGAWN